MDSHSYNNVLLLLLLLLFCLCVLLLRFEFTFSKNIKKKLQKYNDETLTTFMIDRSSLVKLSLILLYFLYQILSIHCKTHMFITLFGECVCVCVHYLYAYTTYALLLLSLTVDWQTLPKNYNILFFFPFSCVSHLINIWME